MEQEYSDDLPDGSSAQASPVRDENCELQQSGSKAPCRVVEDFQTDFPDSAPHDGRTTAEAEVGKG
jgi:hypothetical protein